MTLFLTTDITYSWGQAISDLGQIAPIAALTGFLLFAIVTDLALPKSRRGDAVAMLARHVRRVCHVHCKDIRPQVLAMAWNRNWSFLESVINGAFTPATQGATAFYWIGESGGLVMLALVGVTLVIGRVRRRTSKGETMALGVAPAP